VPTQHFDYDYDRSIGFLVSDCYRLHGTTLDRQLRQNGLGLSPSQWRVIGHLSRTDGLTQTQLAELLNIERAPLGTLIDKLEGAKLVERQADASDRRLKRVFITPAGLSMLPTIIETAAEITQQITQGLSETQLAALIDGLQIVKQNLQRLKEK